MMSELFFYVVAASKDPDRITCRVPYEVDSDMIFFGPCLKNVRKKFRDRYLSTRSRIELRDDIYLVGVNRSNHRRLRKILWAGRVKELMTFEEAFKHLTGGAYKKMRSSGMSPVHLKPLYNSDNRFIGYEHVTDYHLKDSGWVTDVVSKPDDPRISVSESRLLLRNPADRWAVFDRDCCFVCENIFFAVSEGLTISDKIKSVLKRAQPDRPGVDSYAVFGLNVNGKLYGRRGNPLCIRGEQANELISLIRKDKPDQLEGVDVKKDQSCTAKSREMKRDERSSGSSRC